MLHVFADGSLEINSEKISITDPAGSSKLEHQINKHHAPVGAHKPMAAAHSAARAAAAPPADPRRFRVKLDHLGHVLIEWGHGIDREETGLRGLATLITNGLIRKPGHYRVDPMQRSIEIDGVTFECNEAGVKRLEEALNTRYAPSPQGSKGVAIEIKENLAASTRFDIHFRTSHAGVTHDIKGHLTQELLDVLQDPAKCDLIQPGIHLLLSPPNLLIRRRRADMGEERIPELPDVNLLRLTSVQLQQIINHPLIRRNSGATATESAPTAGDQSAEIVEMRVVRNPAEKMFLWLECVTARGEPPGPKAFTHHNIAELQHGGCFLPYLEVCLSLDQRRLSIHDNRTHKEEAIKLDPQSCPDEVLREASRMLTWALKHSAARSASGKEPARVRLEPPSQTTPGGGPAKATAKPAPATDESAPTLNDALPSLPSSKPAPDPAIVALFRETDAVRINQEIFRRLGVHLGLAPQEAQFSLPMVFENRRFEILNFERQEVASIMELRGTDFYGFYLSHVSEKKVLLVYACNGMHIEWGPDRCVLQPTIKSEAVDYPGSVLLGMAQDKKNEFVFVVQPDFKKWIAPREMPFTEENLQFLVVADIAAAPENYKLIWPERPAA